MRLKQALTAIDKFESIRLLAALAEAASVIEFANNLDVVFVSDCFSVEELELFISRAKQTRRGRGAAYIILKSGEQSTLESLLDVSDRGADGCLFQPYSVENLKQVIEIAEHTRSLAVEVREGECLRSVLHGIGMEIDRLSLIAKAGAAPKFDKHFLDLALTLAEWHSRSPQLYEEQLLREFCAAQLPNVSVKPYTGASERVRRMTEQKLQEELLGEGSQRRNRR